MVPTKPCNKCGEIKPLDAFTRHKAMRDGHINECKPCVVKRTSGRDRSAYNKAYRKLNRDALAQKAKDRGPAHDAAYHAKYRAENREAVLENERRYRQKNRHKETARRHARRAVPMDAAAREYTRMIINDPCSYCAQDGGTLDHITAITKGGDNDWRNLTGACMSCNSRKRTKSLLRFMLDVLPTPDKGLAA